MGYFDTSAAHDYSLTPSGMKAFRSLAASTFFQPFRHATSVSPVSVPSYEASPIGGQEVQLSSDLSSTDFGGSLSFFALGASTPLRGCAAVPVSQGTSCNTDALPVGATHVVAVYNGDPSSRLPIPTAAAGRAAGAGHDPDPPPAVPPPVTLIWAPGSIPPRRRFPPARR